MRYRSRRRGRSSSRRRVSRRGGARRMRIGYRM